MMIMMMIMMNSGLLILQLGQLGPFTCERRNNNNNNTKIIIKIN